MSKNVSTPKTQPKVCTVCLEYKNKTIACFTCDTIVCVVCCKAYLRLNNQEAHCMKCNSGWGLKFLIENFSKSWAIGSGKNSYRTIKKEMIYDRERSQIPKTLAELADGKRKIYEMTKQRDEVYQKMFELRKLLRKYQDQHTMLCAKIKDKNFTKTGSKYAFLCPCPVNECKGMIDAKTKICVLCDVKVCTRCFSIKGKGGKKENKAPPNPTHVCDESDIASVKEIKKKTRPCPECAARIFKISGCDQMWCTSCNTPFSWRNGTIVSGTIHNPHAIAWYRANGNKKGEENLRRGVGCGGLRPSQLFFGIVDSYAGRSKKKILTIYQSVAEVRLLLTYFRPDDGALDKFRELYLVKQIDEKTWKRRIFLLERRNDRKRAGTKILETYQTLGTECINSLYDDLRKVRKQEKYYDKFLNKFTNQTKPQNIVRQFFVKIRKIREFINDAFRDELSNLGTKNPIKIRDDWFWSNRRCD